MATKVKRSAILFFVIWISSQLVMLLLFDYYQIPITRDLIVDSCGVFALVAAFLSVTHLMTESFKKQR